MNKGLTEETGDQGEDTDCEVTLSAEPFGDLTRSFAKCIGKLLLRETLIAHKDFYFSGYGKGDVDLCDDFLWHA